MNQTVVRLVETAKAVADAEPARIEQAAQQLGASRRYLAPIAWAAGTLVLAVRGIRLLCLNWRLSLIELAPATWVWLAMWDVRRNSLRAAPLQTVSLLQVAVGLGITIGASVAAFWCNAVFGFAVSHERPDIRRAVGQTGPHLGRIIGAGAGMGVLLAVGLAVLPRIDSTVVYALAILALYGVMLVSLVLVPARILGVTRRRLAPRETVGRWVTGGALSAVAMTPGFVVDRIGLVLLAVPHLHLLGLVVLSLGVGLYAAGLSSVKAVKLSMRLEQAPQAREGAT